jgi:phage shock protein E
MSVIEDKIKSGAKIFDVRTSEEYMEEHYPNAINISVNDVLARLNDFGDKNAPIVVYCASGSRSAYAAKLLKTSGFTDVVNAGGLGDMPNY